MPVWSHARLISYFEKAKLLSGPFSVVKHVSLRGGPALQTGWTQPLGNVIVVLIAINDDNMVKYGCAKHIN